MGAGERTEDCADVRVDKRAGANAMLGVWDRMRTEAVEVDPRRCAVFRNRNASCRRCAQACPSGCIGVLDSGQLNVDAGHCLDCGCCAAACPTGAIAPREPDAGALHAACVEALAVSDGGEVVLACRHAGVDARVPSASVRCLGGIDESLLVRLAADGARTVVLAHGDCAACPRGRACDETLAHAVELARGILSAWGSSMKIEPVSWPADSGFVESIATIVSDECDPSAERPDGVCRFVHVGPDGTLPHEVPARRAALMNALEALGVPDPGATVPPGVWWRVSIDADRCISCRSCSVFCPTGALERFADEDGAFGLINTPERCVGCASCRDACRRGALILEEVLLADEMRAGQRVRLPMAPPTVAKGGAHSITDSIRAAFGSSRIYER